MKYNYFTYNGIVYVIAYDKNKRIFYRLDNNKLIPLNEVETKIINDLFVDKDGYMYFSEKLNKIVNSNKRIIVPESINILEVFNWFEKTIPKKYLDNFYSRLATLEMNLHLNAIYDKEILASDYGKVNSAGGYNVLDNTIILNPNSVKVVYQIAQKTNNSLDFFYNEIIHTLIHELWHMASSKHDWNSKVVVSGFDTYPTDNVAENNRGLTEGMTEFLATCALPSRFELANSYYFETCFIIQLCVILDFNVLLDSYLENKGTKILEDRLTQLGFDSSKAYELFRNIQANYYLFNVDGKQNLLGNIQDSLLDYLDVVCALDNRKITLLDTYEKVLVTLEVIKGMNKKPDNYEGIDENIRRFKEIKSKYKTADVVRN